MISQLSANRLGVSVCGFLFSVAMPAYCGDSDDLLLLMLPAILAASDTTNGTGGTAGEIYHLNDTGIYWGGDSSVGNAATCTSNIAGPQDCHQGRDHTYSDESDGHAGFSFTKLSISGARLPLGSSNWACVKDNITGLIWEVKTNDGGVHDRNNRYRWGGVTHLGNGYGLSYWNDWDDLVNLSKSSGYCGRNNWRVPTVKELQGLVDYGRRQGTAIDIRFFPNTPERTSFWTSSPYSGSSMQAWAINFESGNFRRGLRSFDHLPVRLVSGTPGL